MRGGANLSKIITGDNKEEHVGRLVRLVDLEYPEYPWIIHDLFNQNPLTHYLYGPRDENDGNKIGRILSDDDIPIEVYDILLSAKWTMAMDYVDWRTDMSDNFTYIAVEWKWQRHSDERWISYFEIPNTLDDTKTMDFPYYLELYKPGKGRYDNILDEDRVSRNLRTRRKKRIARRNLASAKIPFDNESMNLISRHLSNMPIPHDVQTRMNDEIPYDEYLENSRMAEYLDDIGQFGGNSRRRWRRHRYYSY